MIDLETIGTDPGSIILSIGAVAFDPYKEEINLIKSFYSTIDIESSKKAGFDFDTSTLIWWMNRSEEAQEVFHESFSEFQNDIDTVLCKFATWLPKDAIVWGCGSDFDNCLLATAYKKLNFIPPWKFWNNRCYRTIKMLYKDVTLCRQGIYHNALDDAKHQAMHLCKIAQEKKLSI